jgi:iron complex outermembrane receptor protein
VFDIAPGFSDFIGLNRSDDIDYVGSQMQELKEHSIYGEIAYDIIPQWEILFGARQFHYRDDVTSCFGYPIGYGLEGDELDLECWGGKDKQNDVLGKFSTKYQLNQNQNIYFTIAEGFRRGGANFLPSDVENNRSYQPDTATNYELGHHGYFLQQQLRVSAALFYTDWEDIQIPTVVDGAYNAWGNAKGARSEGIELEARAKLSHGWSITTGVTVTDAELTEDVLNLNGGDENAYAGNTLPGSARYQWHLGVDYTRTFSQAILDVEANISHLSEIYTALNSEFADYDRLAGYSIANVHARVTWRNWQVGAFIHNIANTRGVTSTRTSGWYGEQGQFENITRPRTLGVSVNYTY